MSAIQNIQEQLKGLSVEELLAVITAAAAEAKKATKAVPKVKEAKEKKGSMPKGVVPPQLHKPRAWVDFVLAHANANGWPTITVKGQAEPLPASVERDGAHIFESTVKPLNNKQAMSLSKQYWDRKAGVGSKQELYNEFEATYVAPEPVEASAASEVKEVIEAPKKVAAPKKTEAEKEAEKQAKALKKAAEKEAEKLKKAQEAAAEKERKAAEKKAAEEPKEAPKKIATPKKVAKKEEKDTFKCEDDGEVHPWDWKGKKLLRNFQNQVWARTDEGEAGDWFGVYDVQTNTIDASAEEPVFEDE